MSYGDCYRYYNYEQKHLNLLIIRTSEKCFLVIVFGYSFHGLKTQIQKKSFRSWLNLQTFAEGFIKEVI